MWVLWIRDNFLYILLAVATIYGCFWLNQYSDKLKMKGWMAIPIAILHTAIGVACVTLFAFLESGDGGKMSLFGAVFFMPVLYILGAKLTKRKISDVIDIFSVTMIFTLMCARVNCLLSGCCLGAEIPGTQWRWPTRELELVFYAVILIYLWSKVGKPGFSGKAYPIYMMAYGAFRFCVEWLRETDNPIAFFHISHIWSLVSIAVGAGLYIYYFKKPKHRADGKKTRKSKEETK